MLEVIGAAPGSHAAKDWAVVWKNSPEREAVREEIDQMKVTLSQKQRNYDDPTALDEFAAPFAKQLKLVLYRVFQQYWRTPVYIYSKILLATATSLFVGFSFYNAGTSIQGIQNQLFAVFMLLNIFGNLVQQIMPNFVTQRALYEVRERPSKAYSWQSFLTVSVMVILYASGELTVSLLH
jgi:ATP-binding cassette, subfamily G (WHITE), member 2, PDR